MNSLQGKKGKLQGWLITSKEQKSLVNSLPAQPLASQRDFSKKLQKKTCQFFNFAVELSSMPSRNGGSYNPSVGSICLLSPGRDEES